MITRSKRSGNSILRKLGGLIRTDGKILYPIRDGIPLMLISEGIAIQQTL